MHDNTKQPDLRRSSDDDRLTRLEYLIYGNGGSGVVERIRRIERFMFEDPQTGERGLVNDVKLLNESVRSFQTTLRTLNWILATLGAGGVVAFIRSIAA